MKKILLIGIPVVLLGLYSCGDSENTSIDVKDTSVELDTTDLNNDYNFTPPSPLKVASIFRKAGLKYDENLLNPTSNINKYSTYNQKALNFGIYSSDLAYCILNKQSEKGADYLKAIRQLGTDIGLATIFNSDDLINRFEANISNTDSIVELLTDIQSQTDDYIQENGENELAVIYYTGAWVEGMYFGAKTAMDSKDRKLGGKLSEQMNIANTILKGFEAIKVKQGDIIELEAAVRELVDMFNNFESVKAIGDDIDFLDAELSEEEVTSLAGKIIELRTKITQP
jgi:hypothetical protein